MPPVRRTRAPPRPRARPSRLRDAQDWPSGPRGRPQRCSGHDVTDADGQEHQRHHPPVGGADRRERTDSARHLVEGPRLQHGGNRPASDQHDRRGGRRDHAPPRHPPRPPHRSTVGEDPFGPGGRRHRRPASTGAPGTRGRGCRPGAPVAGRPASRPEERPGGETGRKKPYCQGGCGGSAGNRPAQGTGVAIGRAAAGCCTRAAPTGRRLATPRHPRRSRSLRCRRRRRPAATPALPSSRV